MKARKMIGVILPVVTEELDTLFLDGIYRQASEFGYHVAAFTCSANTQNETIQTGYILGEEKIYRLVCRADLDGLIFAAGRFQDPTVAGRILESLQGIRYPCVTTGYENDRFPNFCTPQDESVRRITEHLIRDHGFTDILCLTGPAGNREAEERLSGFRAAMRDAGLNDSRFVYGDFWKNKAIRLADDIAAGITPRPQAVVCASDIMAITLCERLVANGIKVPEDIAVTGFDGGRKALLTYPSLTTVNGKEFETGSNAAVMLLRMLTGKDDIPFVNAQYISYGGSCGCAQGEQTAFLAKSYDSYMKSTIDREIRMTSNYINMMADSDSFEELSKVIDRLSYILPQWNDMYICICQELAEISRNIDTPLPEDYTDHMQLFVSKHRTLSSDNQCIFETKELLPANVQMEAPQFFVITPLHNKGHIYGYFVTTYDDPRQYIFDDLYVGWKDSVSNALSVQHIKMQNKYLHQRLTELSERDPFTGMLNLKGVTAKLTELSGSSAHFTLAILEMMWVQTPRNQFEADPYLFIANAVQMNCSARDICFRYNESVFGVFLYIPETLEAESCFEQWTVQFDSIVDTIIQRNKSFEKPVISFFCEPPGQMPAEQTEIEQIILRHLSRQPSGTDESVNFIQQLDELRRRIKKSPELQWELPAAAAEMQISESYFRILYKKHFGTSFHADLIEIRIHAAMKLLRKTDMSIQAISVKCGYKNVYHFMSAFRKKTGMTAKKYRESFR